MTVRMDAQLKQKFDALCSQFGMSVNTAFNIFANAVVRAQAIPFMVGINTHEPEDETLKAFREFRAQVAASSMPDMTLDEINEEIRLAREEIDRKKAAS